MKGFKELILVADNNADVKDIILHCCPSKNAA